MDSPFTVVMPIACYADRDYMPLKRASDNLELATDALNRAIRDQEPPFIIAQLQLDQLDASHAYALQRRLLLTPRTPPQPIPRPTVLDVDKRRRALRFAAIFAPTPPASPYSPNSSP